MPSSTARTDAAQGQRANLPPPVDTRVRYVTPSTRRVHIKDLLRIGDVLRVLVSRDLKVKYKQSVLGPLWLVFQPLALLLVFIVAFRGLGNVKTGNIPYAVFALVGLGAWSYVQTTMTICVASMLSNQSLVRWTPAPRVALFSAGLFSSLPSFGITFAASVVAAAATGHLSIRILLIPFAVGWLIVLTAGPAAFLASLAVRFRDVLSSLPFLLQLGSFVAPVGYALAGLSPTARHIVELNPLTGLIETMRWMTLSGYHAELTPILVALGLTAMILAIGWNTFGRLEPTMADVI
jgi:ABC-type polysaccharide/polyol phosphate export permease